MDKSIRRGCPAGAEYCSIVSGKICYYKIEGEARDVSVWVRGEWRDAQWLDFTEVVNDPDFRLLRINPWKEWVWSIVFVLGFVTVLGVVYEIG